MSANTTKTKVIKRVLPCTCGCKGQDPQHARSYQRVLVGVHEETGTCQVSAYREPVAFQRAATVQLPWGIEKAVEVVLDNGYVLGWFIAAE